MTIDASATITVLESTGTPSAPYTDAEFEAAVVLATEILNRQADLSAAVTAEDPQAATAVIDEAVSAAAGEI